MIRSFIHHPYLVWSFVFFSFTTLAPQPGAAQSDVQPVRSSVSASTALPDSFVVSGNGFTPGGDVYIALYDQWGMILNETRWVAASESIHGPNGSQDPAQG